MALPKKRKWTSFDELKEHLEKEKVMNKPEAIGEIELTNQDRELIIRCCVDLANTGSQVEDFFHISCDLSRVFEGLDDGEIKRLIDKTNVHVSILSSVFTNPKIVEVMRSVILMDRSLEIEAREQDEVSKEEIQVVGKEEKTLLKMSITSAFFPLALYLPYLSSSSVSFFRKHVGHLTTILLKTTGCKDVYLRDVCFQIEEIVRESEYNYSDGKFPIRIDGSFYYETLKKTRSVAGIAMLGLSINGVVALQFRKVVKEMDSEGPSYLLSYLNDIYGSVYRINRGITGYYHFLPETEKQVYEAFHGGFVSRNEKGLLCYIQEVTAGFRAESGGSINDLVLKKIKSSQNAKENVHDFAHGLDGLSALTSSLDGKESEWSNKIYIASMKTLSALISIENAHDKGWKFSVGLRELDQWIREVHKIMNKFFIEDEFDSIASLLEDETVSVEWKTSFYTPSQLQFISPEAEKQMSRRVFLQTVKAVLGMINTEGGVVIVGFVEYPEKVVRDDVVGHLTEKNGKVFFDIGFELEEMGRSLDQVRLQLLDNLTSITGSSEDAFNGLFELESVIISGNNGPVTIVKVAVQKSENIFFKIREIDGSLWVALTRRANGKTIDVDPRSVLN